MLKRWLTQIGNCEFIHKTPKDALSYGDEKIQVTEMISIDLYEKYVDALEQEKQSGNVYMQAYRAGWNDALHELAIDGGNVCAERLLILANSMKKP